MPGTHTTTPRLDKPLDSVRRTLDGPASNAAVERDRLDAEDLALVASQLAMVGGHVFSVRLTNETGPVFEVRLSQPEGLVTRVDATLWRGARPTGDLVLTESTYGTLSAGWNYVYAGFASGSLVLRPGTAPDGTGVGAAFSGGRDRFVGCFYVDGANPYSVTRIGHRSLYRRSALPAASGDSLLYAINTASPAGTWTTLPLLVPPHAHRAILELEFEGGTTELRTDAGDLQSIARPSRTLGASDWHFETIEIPVTSQSIQYQSAATTLRIRTLGWE